MRRRRLSWSCAAAKAPRSLAVLALVGVVASCKRPQAAAPSYELRVMVEDDAKAPLAGAAVLRDGKPLGTTDASGKVQVRLSGIEGDRIPLQVRCPATYVPPTAALEVSLRRIEDASRFASYRVSCSPELRTVVVAVRASNGPNLPVLYLGREVARTDGSGAAHVELRLRTGERFELVLATRDKEAERLTPQNPIGVFVVKNQDEVLFFNQKFELPGQKSKVSKRQRPRAF